MSVYVGIDVHRKRSQIAVLDQEGTVRINWNVPNGVGPVLGVIGDLPIGTPVAFEAAYGWGRLVELLEGYGLPAASGASAAMRVVQPEVAGCGAGVGRGWGARAGRGRDR